jgi:hypothetical protein
LIEATLVHHWSLSSTKDEIGNATLFDGFSVNLVSNRYGIPFRSTEFKNGCLLIPRGLYIEESFSLSAWVNLKVNKLYSVLVSFANDNEMIWIGFKGLSLHVEIKSGSNNGFVKMTSNLFLKKDVWTHITFVLKDSIGYIYFNGSEINKGSLTRPNSVETIFNFIGQDYYNSSLYLAEAIYEELKIYRGALTEVEVKNEFNNECK